jgi:hypothetical protein
MADEITAAPKKAFSFAKNNLLAFAILAAVLLLLFVAYESRNPGKLAAKVGQAPLVGDWALNRKKAG